MNTQRGELILVCWDKPPQGISSRRLSIRLFFLFNEGRRTLYTGKQCEEEATLSTQNQEVSLTLVVHVQPMSTMYDTYCQKEGCVGVDRNGFQKGKQILFNSFGTNTSRDSCKYTSYYHDDEWILL